MDANSEWGDFVWGDGGSPPPFIASSLGEESGFNKGMCSAKCRLNHMCCGNKVKKRRNACFAGCNAQEIAYLAEAEAAVGGGGGGGSGNGGGWDEDLALDLAEVEAENAQLRSQLAGGGNGAGGTNGKMGNMLIIGGIVVVVIVLVIFLMKK